MSPNVKSFMIDDILRSDTEKACDGENDGKEGTKEAVTSHYNFIGSDFGSNLQPQQFSTSFLTPHPSSIPLMQGKKIFSSSWERRRQKEEISSFSHKAITFCKFLWRTDPRIQTLFWQHLFLRRKIMLQLKPRKGGQIRFSHQQIIDLEKRFGKSKYLSASERKRIAGRINLTERQVKTWFQNRRAKWRRGQGMEENGDESDSTITDEQTIDQASSSESRESMNEGWKSGSKSVEE